MTASAVPEHGRGGRALVLTGIVLLAFNLRPAAVSVGPVLDEVTSGLGMSGTEAGVLTSLPVLAFAGFGGLAPRLANRVGGHRLTLVALVAVVVGLFARSRVDGVLPFLALSLVALAGMATANVVLPSLVRLHFPGSVGTMTAVYSTALAVGLTSASVLTVPVSEAYGGWRDGLAAWGLLALVAAVPWIALVGQDRGRRTEAGRPGIALGDVLRTRLGILMALLFGFQSLHAYAIFGWLPEVYRGAGFSAHTAGLLLGVVTGTSIPLSFVIPAVAARMHSVAGLLIVLVALYPIGYVGLILAPRPGAWLWAVVIGAATSTFPLVLTLIGLRARTPDGTAALSGSTQGAGYLLAIVGPFGFGALHDLSGGWTLPLLGLTAMTVPLLAAGLGVARPAYIEDQVVAPA